MGSASTFIPFTLYQVPSLLSQRSRFHSRISLTRGSKSFTIAVKQSSSDSSTVYLYSCIWLPEPPFRSPFPVSLSRLTQVAVGRSIIRIFLPPVLLDPVPAHHCALGKGTLVSEALDRKFPSIGV